MGKYKIKDKIIIKKILWPDDEDARNYTYAIIDQKTELVYLINDTIQVFFSVFSQSITMKQAFRSFSKKTRSNPRLIAKTFKDFYSVMEKNGFIGDINMHNEETPVLKPTEIPSYCIIELLGNNEKSSTYLSRNEITGEKFIIKKFSGSNTMISSLYQNCLVLNNSPFFAKCYKYLKNENALVLEFCLGINLDKVLVTKRLSLQQKAEIFNNILEAISYLHSLKMTHGDISLSNILYHRGEIKFIDPETIYNNSEHSLFISSGNILNIAPENLSENVFKRIEGLENTVQTDLYQLGLIAYQLFYGQIPFQGNTWKEITRAKILGLPNFNPVHRNNGDSVFLKKVIPIVRQLLHTKPEMRPTSIAGVQKNFNLLLTNTFHYVKS